ncbi:MAG: ribonuclease P protein component [Planctomycetota bacterium]|jgi:ribonuclease P protein component
MAPPDEAAPDDRGGASPRRFRFRRTRRLVHARQYQNVFRGGIRSTRGPLTVYGLPNDLPHSRLGLSVGGRVGGAVTRNRVKRLIRDAFRLMQHDLTAGYDLVVAVRRHEPLTLDRYRDHLRRAVEDLHRTWTKQSASKSSEAAPPRSPREG